MRGFPPALKSWVFRPAKSVFARLRQLGCTASVPIRDALSADVPLTGRDERL